MLAILSPSLLTTPPAATPAAPAGSGGSPGFARLLDGAAQARAEAQSQQRQQQEASLQDARQAQQHNSDGNSAAALRAPASQAASRSAPAKGSAPPPRPATADTVAAEVAPRGDAAQSSEAQEPTQTTADGLSELLAQMRGTAPALPPDPTAQAAPATPGAADGAAAAHASAAAADGGKSARAPALNLDDPASTGAPQAVAGPAGDHAGPGQRAGTGLRARQGGAGHSPATNTAPRTAAVLPTASSSAPAAESTLAAQAAGGAAARTGMTAMAAMPGDGPPTLPVAGIATAAPAAGAPAAPTPTALPSEARLSAAPGSADFAPQLGAQITTFARHGIEHARLHLNPADMGPVMVQIQLDGAAAQIHMSADHPATRQALEQAMPALASGLREAGLTLAGGGVFEQPQQAQDQAQARSDAQQRQAAAPASQAGAGPHDTMGSSSRPALQRRGLVDLVA
jgi:flagellar hook-length control protein FliK